MKTYTVHFACCVEADTEDQAIAEARKEAQQQEASCFEIESES